MGSSKPREVSTAGRKLLEEHADQFSRDFSKNSEKVNEYLDCNKSMRNEIAGWISSEMRKKANKKAK